MPATDMITGSSVAAVLSNPRLPDNPIIACNDAFVALTGFTRDEIIGYNCRFLKGEGTEAHILEALRSAIREQRPVMVEILNYKKSGQPFRNAVLVAPMFDADGELEYFLGSQMEVALNETAGARADIARTTLDELTPRQKAVLAAMAGGRLNKQIAFEMGLSERTIKMHRAAMLKALGVRSTAEALRLAIEAGL